MKIRSKNIKNTQKWYAYKIDKTNLQFQSNLKKIKKMIKDVEIYQNYKNLEMKVTEIIKMKGISELKTKSKGTSERINNTLCLQRTKDEKKKKRSHEKEMKKGI